MLLKILLADSNRFFLSAVNQLLGALRGTQVVGQACDGHTTLVMARQMQPDLVLLDVAMPDMSNRDLAHALRALPNPPRIVFLSMHTGDLYYEAAHELGADDIVDKAEFVVKLLPVIERLIVDRQSKAHA